MLSRTCWKWTAAALLLAAAAGCRRTVHRSSSSSDDDIFTTDDFPGAPVQDSNVGDDLRAFSNSGEDAQFVLIQKNGDRGTAIATYATKGIDPAVPYHLYVHYFDGQTWTPPVVLEAPDVDFSQSATPAAIAFINTSEHASASAQARDGDAIVFWMADDVDDDGPATADGQNHCLFATYFDVTHAAEPDRRYGFQTLGVRLNPRDMADENVNSVRLVTDGICGEWGTQRVMKYGDQTTGIVVTWNQAEDNDLLTAFPEDRSLWSAWFDVAGNPDPESPIVPAPSVRLPVLGFGASDAGASSEETQVGSFTIAYNNLIFFRVASRATPGSGLAGNDFPPDAFSYAYGAPFPDGNDVTLQEIAFNLATGTYSGPNLLAVSAPDSTDAWETNSSFLFTNAGLGLSPILETQSVWGSDEGLAQVIFLHTELPSDPDAATDFGNGFIDGGLYGTGIDEATGTVQSGVILSADDPTIFDTVIEGYVEARLSRNGDYLWIAWLQPSAAGASDDLALHAAEIKTTRLGDTPPPISLATSLTLDLSTDIDGYDVGWLQIQNGLGYVCGAQSDPDVMNIFFQHSDGTRDEVFVARLTAGHTVPPTPGAVVTSFETFEDGELPGGPILDTGARFNSCDSGEGGNAIAFYRRDVDGTSGTDYRFFAKRTGDASRVEVGSGSSDRQARNDLIDLVITPPGSEIGVFDPVTLEDDPARAHPAGTVHALIREDRYVTGSGTGPALRARVYDASSGSPALDQAIRPPVGAAFQPPFELELPNADPDKLSAPRVAFIGVDEDTVGVWFSELRHVYYQEYDPDSGEWRTRDGVSDPALVDDDASEETFGNAIVFADTCTCSNLHGAMCAWLKDLSGGTGRLRLQVRTRD